VSDQSDNVVSANLVGAEVGRRRGPRHAAARLASFGLAIILIVLPLFTFHSAFSTYQAGTAAKRASEKSNVFQDARYAIGAEESLERKYRLEPSVTVRQMHREAAASLEAALNRARGLDEAEDGNLVNEVLAKHRVYLAAIDRMFSAIDAGDSVLATEIDGTQVDPAFSHIEARVDSVSAAYRIIEVQNLQALAAIQSGVLVTTPIVLVLGVGLAAILWRLLRAYRRDSIEATRRGATAISRSEKRFRSLVQNSSDVFLICTSSGVITYQSVTAESAWGYAAAALLGRSIATLMHPDDQAAWRDLSAKLSATPRGTVTTELRLRDAGGAWRQYEFMLTNLLDEPAIEGLVATARDITDLKRSEESFRLLLEKNPLPMWVCDHETLRFLAVNEAAIEHYGYSKVAFLAMTILDIGPAEDREEVTRFIGARPEPPYQVSGAFRHLKTGGAEIEVVIYAREIVFEGRAASVIAAIDVTEQRQAERRLTHYARHDALTNLSNRIAFSEHIESVLQSTKTTNESFALLCIDVDRFKAINDGFGHPVGDQMLCEVARRLLSAAEGSFVARFGGDEFAIVSPIGTGPAAAAQIADHLHSAVAGSFEIQGQSLSLGLSIGVALYPADGPDEITLLKNADAALYRAKNNGRGDTYFFQPKLDLQLRERHAMQRDLALAVARNELLLYYQPQGRMNREIVGFEALVRWRDRERGMVGPDVFIPLAEDSGLILQIGEWVLREACREAASWPIPLTVSVNISPVQFRNSDLVGLVHATLVETGLPPQRLQLEITEGLMIRDKSSTLAILRRIKALGVSIAMDDFGSGYSSLAYLQTFPFDKIKIDQNFVANLDRNSQSAAIIRAVIGLGRGLQIPILAEGVETEEQLAFLVRESCDEVQGYLFGRPRPIAEYAEIVGRPREEQSIRSDPPLRFSSARNYARPHNQKLDDGDSATIDPDFIGSSFRKR
jgi:diguanylate cyclase (GGDEF)-like protein/PAS domain S-box-containing protein